MRYPCCVSCRPTSICSGEFASSTEASHRVRNNATDRIYLLSSVWFIGYCSSGTLFPRVEVRGTELRMRKAHATCSYRWDTGPRQEVCWQAYIGCCPCWQAYIGCRPLELSSLYRMPSTAKSRPRFYQRQILTLRRLCHSDVRPVRVH